MARFLIHFFTFLLLAASPLTTVAQADTQPPRLALLIGNQGYSSKVGALKNPHNDVALLEASLKRLGFTVTVVRDGTYKQIDTALKRYVTEVRRAGRGAISFFYYSGHGVSNPETQINYLIPVDVADADDDKVWFESFQQNVIIDLMSKQAPAATHYLVFDACRNELNVGGANSKALGSDKGFAPIADTSGLLIAYATAPKRTASDVGDGGGPYARVLAEELTRPNIEAVSMFRNVQIRVKEAIGQDPWLSFPSLPPVYLAGREASPGAAAQPTAALPPPAPSGPSEAAQAWERVRQSDSEAVLEAFGKQFAGTVYAAEAQDRLTRLRQAAQERQRVAALQKQEQDRRQAEAAAAAKQAEDKRRAESQVTECDRLAAIGSDPRAVAPGREIPKTDAQPAVTACEAAVAAHPGLARFRTQLGKAFYARGDMDRAVVELTRALDIEPRYAQAFAFRGLALHNKDADRAIQDYTRAIEIDAQLTFAVANRGLLYLHEKSDYDRAIADLTRVVEGSMSGNPRMWYSRGAAHEFKRDNDRAAADYSKAIEIDPRYVAAYVQRGIVRTEKSDFDLAIADLTKAIEIEPTSFDAYLARGVAHFRKDDHKKAIADYTKAIEIKPTADSGYFRRGIAYSAMNDDNKAIADYTKAIELNPKSASAFYNRGTVHNRKKNYDRAIADFTSAIAAHPKHASAHNNRGNAYMAKDEVHRARADFNKAVEIEPRNARYYVNRGLALERLNERALAIADYQTALSLDASYDKAADRLKELTSTQKKKK
ncbi:MAG: tetratricopeptide repeat protein [Hyphomicrobiales bacterium]|nr:tetratricopeptide repeat protein [Hyphomicrobiales bacterium]